MPNLGLWMCECCVCVTETIHSHPATRMLPQPTNAAIALTNVHAKKVYIDKMFDDAHFPRKVMEREETLSLEFVEQLLDAERAVEASSAATTSNANDSNSDQPSLLDSFVPSPDFKLVILTGRPVQVNNPLFPYLQSCHLAHFQLPDDGSSRQPRKANSGGGGGGGGGGGSLEVSASGNHWPFESGVRHAYAACVSMQC